MNPLLSIYRRLPRHDRQEPSAVTIGNFDGVHLGHQAIVARLCAAAREQGLASCVMTFVPHPRAYFAARAGRPADAPAQISTLRDKIHDLSRQGVEQILLQGFDETLASMPAPEFVRQLLVQGLQTRWLLVGEDFRFGHRRTGDIELLHRMGAQLGFEVQAIGDVVSAAGQRISSSRLREALARADLSQARQLLGRPYRISGRVVHGRKLGRSIGFPTLNLAVPGLCAARNGVYVVRVSGLSARPQAGVASLGVRPTVQRDGQRLLEVHLLDTQPDAYGKLACVDFLSYLRDEAQFPDLPTMTAAIENDAQQARQYVATHGL